MIRKTDASGFTLVEVLVATFLVGLISLAVAPMMLMAVQTSAVAQEMTELTAAGVEQMEIMRALPFTHADLAAGGSIVGSNANYSIDPWNGDPDRYIRWQIVDDNAARKSLTLVVGTQSSIWGPAREIRMETFRTDLQ